MALVFTILFVNITFLFVNITLLTLTSKETPMCQHGDRVQLSTKT